MTRDAALDALREADRRARARSQTEFDRPLVLEAGAGTGKTATLVARVLAWCLGPGWRRAETELGAAAARAGRGGAV
ncbi:MAG TPA: UvrD-helicase domain-containing protein, partial [Thermoanaerobaculaceae bacterium]|nr:UvrD-helicase domain-containing protein [Thermoanaerobaculaceae bacterium]